MSSDPIQPSDVPPHPVPPAGGPTGPVILTKTETTSSGLAPNVAAGLTLILGPITGIIFLFLETKNQFVRFWAMQATFFGAAVVVFSIVAQVVGAVLSHVVLLGWLWWFAYGVVELLLVLVWLYMLFKAFTGAAWELPVLGKLAREQLSRMTPR